MEFLDTTLIDTGTASLTVGQMLLALSAVIVGFVVARVVERLVVGRLRGSAMGPDVLQLVRRLLFYGLMVMVVLGALAILGIPLTAFAFVRHCHRCRFRCQEHFQQLYYRLDSHG